VKKHVAVDVGSLIASAQAAWPDVVVDANSFQEKLVELLDSGQTQVSEHAGDLYLAFASGLGNRRAAIALSGLVETEVPRALSRMRQSPSFVQDVQQRLLEKLLVAPDLKIRGYLGRGPLKSWIRAAAVRTALHSLESSRRQRGVAEAPVRPGADDPELAQLRHRYLGPLKAAVESALRSLPVDERNALRLHFLDGMTVEQIARIRGIHKSNVSRLISRTRRTVLGDVKKILGRELNAEDPEIESIMRQVRSQLDVSFERALTAK
jgi:RNA polymerase sigma-70 factor, ECF subfamily